MNISTILLAILFLVAIFNRVRWIILDIKGNNTGKLKADIFFLSIIIIVGFILFFALNAMKSGH